MDDITRKHLDGMEQRLGEKIAGVREDVRGRLETVASGLTAAMNASIAAGFKAASEERRALHAETLHRFQLVVDDAERIGALAARDRRVTELEAEVSDLRARLDRLEAAQRGS